MTARWIEKHIIAGGPPKDPDPKELVRYLRSLSKTSLAKSLVEATQQLQEQQEKVDFYDTVTKSDKWFAINKAAKLLNFKGIGQNVLFVLLRELKIFMDTATNWNQPYQRYVDAGHFKIVEENFKKNGEDAVYCKTVVSNKGLDFIRGLLIDYGAEPNEPEN